MGDFAAAAAEADARAAWPTKSKTNGASSSSDDHLMKKREEREEAARTKHTQSLRAVAESLNVARETAHTLSMQSEQLDRSEKVVEDTQQVVDLSKRILRGMTWSGWIYNAVSSVPLRASDQNGSQQEELGAHYTNTHEEQSAAQASSGERIARFLEQEYARLCIRSSSHNIVNLEDTLGSRRGPETSRRSSQMKAVTQNSEDIHEEFLRALEPQLAELKEVSLALGNALDAQNSQLERMDQKIDTVQDGVKRVSMQAKKLAGSKLAVNYRFRCAFQEVESGKFLRDLDGEASLSADVVADGCTFRAYTLGDGTELWGFQSEKSSLFFGVNRYGNLKVKGQDFKNYEQFAIDHTKTTTAIFCVSSFFGLGGWITRRDDNSMTIIRGTPENKPQAAKFKIVHLDELAQSSAAR